MFNNSFGMSADGQEFDFSMEGIELDLSTPQFGEFFGTDHCSSSHITGLADVENLDTESLLQPHREVAAGASTGEPSGQPRQLALRHREDSPLLTTYSVSRSFSRIIGTTHGLDSSRPLIVSPGMCYHLTCYCSGIFTKMVRDPIWNFWNTHRKSPRNRQSNNFAILAILAILGPSSWQSSEGQTRVACVDTNRCGPKARASDVCGKLGRKGLHILRRS